EVGQPGQMSIFAELAVTEKDGRWMVDRTHRVESTGRGCMDTSAAHSRWVGFSLADGWRVDVGAGGMLLTSGDAEDGRQLSMASASMDAVIRAEHRSPTDPRSPGPKPSHPGRVLLRFEENPGFDVGESRFGCRSTALGAKGSQTRAPSHPGRVLLRFEKNPGFDAGESRSRCRSTALGAKGSRTRTPSHPGRVLLRFEENPRF